MFVLSCAGIAIAREPPSGVAPYVSFVLQQVGVWWFVALVDLHLARRTQQFAWGALSSLYVTFIWVDALLMRITSLPLREILPMLLASQHVVEGLREIGLRPSRVITLGFLLLAAAAVGGWLRLFLGRYAWPVLPASRALGRAWLVCAAVFVLEQAASREGDGYLYRGLRMPGYIQLFTTSARSVVFPLPPPATHEQRARWLQRVQPARSPRHVLYVLLESFRADVVTPEVCPEIYRLAQRGIVFERALAEATYTPLSWSVLLFDEAAYDNLFGRHPGRPEPLGGYLFALMQRAGYEPHLFVSTNLTYAKTRERLLGHGAVPLDYFQAAADAGEDPADKNRNDRVAVDHAIERIAQLDWKKPQLLLLQLDSTHYTYPFPERDALWKPYSENLALPRPIETEREAELLHNRYRNAAHYVDAQLQRLMAALSRAGVYDQLTIVVTSDHGEGLAPGMQGHGAVSETTRRVPLLLVLPGRAPGRSQRLISHRDILPSLCEYLGIDVPPRSLRGRPYVDRGPAGVLTIAPSGRHGQLTTEAGVVDLSLVFRPDSVVVTPSGAAPAEAWRPALRAFLNP